MTFRFICGSVLLAAVACAPDNQNLVKKDIHVSDLDRQSAETMTVPRQEEMIEHSGAASVIDADTIVIRSQKYRFDGIDSPERGSSCAGTNVYKAGAEALEAVVINRNVECEPNGKRNGDRLIATCYAAVPGSERINLSELMISQGWARDWPKYSEGRYSLLEIDARSARRGMWGLDCPDNLWGTRRYD